MKRAIYTDGVIENRLDVARGEASLLAAAGCIEKRAIPRRRFFASIFAQERPRDDVAIFTMRV